MMPPVNHEFRKGLQCIREEEGRISLPHLSKSKETHPSVEGGLSLLIWFGIKTWRQYHEPVFTELAVVLLNFSGQALVTEQNYPRISPVPKLSRQGKPGRIAYNEMKSLGVVRKSFLANEPNWQF